MGRFRIVVTERAARQLNEVADWIETIAPETAENWFSRAVTDIQSLEQMPFRYGVARESANLPIELREMLIGAERSWRVLYVIRDEDVIVMTIRHSAQRALTMDDLRLE